MMDQTSGHPVVFAAAADLQRLPEGVDDHVGVLGRGDPPAQDPAGKHLDNERDVAETSQRPQVGEVGHPQLIDAGRGRPATLDQVRMPRRCVVATGGDRAVLSAEEAAEPGDLVGLGVLSPLPSE
jgi:hypothetical protein